MKRSKRILILAGALAVVCAATFALTRYEEHKEKIENSDEVILAVDSASVKSLSWESESGTLAFHRDEHWVYDADEAFPVDDEKIEELLGLFGEFGVSFIIEDVEDYGQYGLDEPVCTIKFETEEQSYEVKLGDYSSMDAQRYVSIGDGNVYLVKEDPLDTFDAALNDVIDNDETPVFGQVSGISFSGGEEYEISYEEDSSATYCADDVYFTERDGEKKPLDTSKVESYLSAVSNLNLTDYATYNATEEELQSYGLDDPELTVSVDYTEENEDGEETQQTFVLHVSRDPEERAAAEEKENEEQEEASADASADSETDAEEITAYVRVGESQIVYRITGDEYKSLTAASYDELRHDEVLTADFADITQIDISLEGQEYTLTSKTEDEARTWYYGEEELDISGLQSAVEALRADSFTGEEPSEQQEIALNVHLDNETYPEVSIELYRYDGSHCLAVVDGTPVSLVARSGAVDLIEAVHAIVLE